MPRTTKPAVVVETEAVAPVVEVKPARKAKLTLSQRRALVVLGDEGVVVRKSDFNALPYRYLVDQALAVETDELTFELTETGVERAREINPAYRDWKAGGTVKGGVFAADRLGTARRAVESARIAALEANAR
jgi:hypothetical protein